MLKTLVVMSMVCLPLAAQEAQTNLLRVYGVGGLGSRLDDQTTSGDQASTLQKTKEVGALVTDPHHALLLL